MIYKFKVRISFIEILVCKNMKLYLKKEKKKTKEKHLIHKSIFR